MLRYADIIFVMEQLRHGTAIGGHMSVLLWTQIHVDKDHWGWRRLQEQSSHLVMIKTAIRTTPTVSGSLRHLLAP